MADSMTKSEGPFLYRSLFYFGPEDWLKDCIERRGVKGQYLTDKVRIIEGDCTILPAAAIPMENGAYLRPSAAPNEVELVVYRDHKVIFVKPLPPEVCRQWIKQLVDGCK